MKKIVISILTVLISFSLFSTIHAEVNTGNLEENSSETLLAAEAIANHFLTSLQMQRNSSEYAGMTIGDRIPTYDPNDIENGAVFKLIGENKEGYMTVFNINGILTVSEYSPNTSFEYNGNSKLYCFGILSYYQRVSGNTYRNITTDEIIVFEEVKSELVDYSKSLMPIRTRSYWHADGSYELFGQLPFITQQPNSTACASTSAAMVLQYWKTQKGFSALPLTGTSLRDKLLNYIGGSKANTADIYNGINNYVKSINNKYSIGGQRYSSWSGDGAPTLKDSHLDTLATQLGEYDQPAIVIVGKLAYASNPVMSGTSLHALAVNGVTLYNNGTSYLSCNDPWAKADAANSRKYVSIIWHPANDDPTYFWIYGLVMFSVNGY